MSLYEIFCHPLDFSLCTEVIKISINFLMCADGKDDRFLIV